MAESLPPPVPTTVFPRDSLFGVTPPGSGIREVGATQPPVPELPPRKVTLRDRLEPPPSDRPPSLFLPFDLLKGRNEVVTLDNWKQGLEIKKEEASLLPPGASFHVKNEDGNYQLLEVTDESIPRFNSESLAETYDDLPDYSYFYLDDELGVKYPQSRNFGQIAMERLFNQDQIDDVSGDVDLARIGGQLSAAFAAAKYAGSLPIPNPIVRAGAAGAAGVLAYGAATVAPETFMEWGEALGTLPPGYREKVGLDDEDLRRLVKGEMVLDAAFGGTLTGLRAVGRGLYRLQIPQKMKELASETAKAGYEMLPIQLTGGNAVSRMYVSILGRFPFMAGKLGDRGAAAYKGYSETVQGLPERFHALVGSNATSDAILNDAKDLLRVVNEEVSERYGKVYAQAEEAGLKVIPQDTLETAMKLRKEIQDSVLTGDGTRGALDEDFASLLKILDENILNVIKPKQKELSSFGGNRLGAAPPTTLESGEIIQAVPQDLRTLDSFMATVDRRLSRLRAKHPQGRLPSGVGGLFSELRDAMKGDMVRNVVEPAGISEAGVQLFKRDPEGIGQQIASALRTEDENFSTLMNAVFETSGAKRLATVDAKGLRGFSLPSEEATMRNVDTLMKSLLPSISDSPDLVRNLRKLTDESTFRKIASTYFQRLVDRGIKQTEAGVEVTNPSIFLDRLGVRQPTSSERLVVEEFLDGLRVSPGIETAEKVLTLPQLDSILKSGDLINNIEIPNVSVFVARRALLGGGESGLRSFMPLAGVLMGAGTSSVLFGLPGAIASIGVLMGSRGIGNMLSNPATARPLRDVIQAEIDGVMDKKAFVQLVRGTIRGTAAAGEITLDQANDLLDKWDGIYDELELFEDDPEPITNPGSAYLELEQSILGEPSEEIEETVAVAEPPPFSPMTQSVPAPPIDVTQLPQQPVQVAQASSSASPESRAQYAAMFPDDMASGIIRSGIGSLV
mgnify:FL=1|tara:strand:- start:5107 stop:7989 length:2883 start_codon:yes stop_codon:yes gene_type:complete